MLCHSMNLKNQEDTKEINMVENIPKGTRKINGKIFIYVTTTHMKSTAKWKKQALKEKGNKARIIPVASGYRLYKRN